MTPRPLALAALVVGVPVAIVGAAALRFGIACAGAALVAVGALLLARRV